MRAGPITNFLRLAAISLSLGFAMPAAFADGEPDVWPDLAKEIFHGVPLKDGSDFLVLDAPMRAEDAAIVPITMSVNLLAGDTRHVIALTFVIDHNPAPLVGVFKPGAAITLTSLSTRVRVDSYTNLHLVAELSDGGFYVVERFIKASGGCSAPMLKDPQEAKATMGQMKFRQFAAHSSGAGDEHDIQVMLRHPNNSGMQMDQLSRLYIPPLFVEDLKLWQGDNLVLTVEGGISISEDPNFRVTYRSASTADYRIEAHDSDKHVYKGEFPNKGSQI
ncbi:MAG: quinoprotein dehydrogenase-associated SoxYZ-like carrier [Hyphomicrobiales bacterium]|nr:quinoprotein dehydrogenase-associated SoxYZ-like carrier [Hyphomicrobiales bacterium]MBV9112636.1 quinoprotein dehydrogenase-associated SoxYZ-like carrier [Hyphomicrobiales bacterium]MBV9520914.1 quinoprotein dehydrogenase-associated SoxYZ-like carrier [Hyphomicrobiales bacterium]